MKFRTKATTTIVAAAAITGLGLGASAATAAPAAAPAAAAPTAAPPITGSVTIDPNAIANSIATAIKMSNNREGFVKNLMYDAFYNLGEQKLNVVVMNLSQGHDALGLQGVSGYSSATYDGVTYGIWIFEEGTFINEGDGGWINWGSMGWFEKEGDYTIHFQRGF